MSFLAPWALAIAGLAAIPVVLHLLRHRTRQRVEFPALRYLHRTLREQARTVRIRDLLLLLIRATAIVLLAFAAAGPLVGRGDAGDHQPTDVALIVDNTASMSLVAGERTLFQEAIEQARLSIEAAGPEDRLWLYPLSGGAVAIGATPGEATAALKRIRQTHAGGDALAAVRTAALGLPAEPGRAREIQFLSDGQATGFSGADPGELGMPVVIGLIGDPPREPNGALIAADLSPGSLVTAGIPPEITARVGRFVTAAAPGDSAQIRLDVDGETVEIAATPWDGAAVFRLDSSNPGSIGGRVEIEPSGLRVDDARFFAFRVVRAPEVDRFVRPAGFVARALDALAAVGRLDADGDRLVVYEADSGLPLAPLPETGTAVFLVPPSNPLGLPRFNQYLAALESGWRLAVDPGRGAIDIVGADGVPGLGGVSVMSRYRFEDAGASASSRADTALVRTADGEPWLIRADRGGRTLLLVASPLDPGATTLPVGPAMIPFVEAVALRWAITQGWPGRDFIAGDEVALPPDAATVRMADGTVRRVDGGAPLAVDMSGLYSVARTNGDSVLFAVNPPSMESDLSRVNEDRLASILGPSFALAADPRRWADSIFVQRRGRNVTPWLLAIVALLLVSEIFLASPRVTSAPATRSET